MNNATMYRPSSNLTVQNARAVFEEGLRAIGAGQSQMDLAEITSVDSTAVATLLAWQRASQRRGTALNFVNVPATLQSLMDLYDVAALLHH